MAPVSEAAKKCLYCDGEIGPNALYCPNCMVPIAQLPRRRHPGTLSLFLCVSLLFGSPCAWVIAGQLRSRIEKDVRARATVHAASIHTAKADNQAKALIRQCGPPDRDVSTAYSDPRPPIPFRVLTYSNQHLQFDFVPGGGAQIGDPPPYVWALSGILDTTTNQRITLGQATERMDCAASALRHGAAAPTSSASNDSRPSADPSLADSSSH